MTSKGKNLEIISFSVPRGTATEIEELCGDIGYCTRSELIRDAIRMLAKEKTRIDGLKGKVEGVALALYHHSAEAQVFDVKHHNMDVIRSYMHTDFNTGADKCCDIMVLSGNAKRVREIVYSLEGIKNVEDVRLFLA